MYLHTAMCVLPVIPVVQNCSFFMFQLLFCRSPGLVIFIYTDQRRNLLEYDTCLQFSLSVFSSSLSNVAPSGFGQLGQKRESGRASHIRGASFRASQITFQPRVPLSSSLKIGADWRSFDERAEKPPAGTKRLWGI